MSEITGIVCEYNPFHRGHEYQINLVREMGYAVVCVMSGNFVQRAQTAIADKYLRAKCAVECGADLVLELPVSHATASAERFAYGGVSILNRLFPQASLTFSSECGDADLLAEAASNLASPIFEERLSARLVSRAAPYPIARQEVYEELFGKCDLLSEPNDILAIQYLTAIKRLNSNIKPNVIKRVGSSYKDTTVPDSTIFASATAIRKLISEGELDRARFYMPSKVYNILEDSYALKYIPSMTYIATAILLKLQQMSRDNLLSAPDVNEELADRIIKASRRCVDLSGLHDAVATRMYTSARIRRCILTAFLGITAEDVNTPPQYTVLLAASRRGCELLGHIRKTAELPIITKPSDTDKLPQSALGAYAKNMWADTVYGMASPTRRSADYFIKCKPYIKKD